MPTSDAYWWPDDGLTWNPYFDSYAPRRTTRHEEVHKKCPFCGSRQNVDRDGANCLHCGGDVLHPHVL